jgi:mannose-1-phosphate guanylyltransferase/phosphomannomutase
MNKAVIMAGGFGTRLRPLTMNLPKPMVPILNKPMMGHIVDSLKKTNITDIVSVLYFQPEKISNYFQNGSDFGINMEYVQAVADYGTAGSVRNAHELVELNSRFIIISGDVLTDFDLQKAIDFHTEKESKATLLLTRHETPLQYGIVMTDKAGMVTRFLEKPNWGQVFSDTINTGIYILEPEVMDLIPLNQEFDFSKDLFPLMLQNNMPLYGFIAEGYWRDVGNLDEYQEGQMDALAGKVKLSNDNIKIAKSAKVHPSAQLIGNVVIGENSIIEEDAKIQNSVIGNDCKIGKHSSITGSTLWNSISVGNYADLSNDVICDNTVIGQRSTIQENVFISNDCNIGDDTTLVSNIKLWPKKFVHEGSVLTRSLVQEEKWQRELFAEARISGESNIEIHPEFGAKLGSCMGMVFGKNAKILASRDPNNVSRIMKRSITSGLMSVGVSANDLQMISIPQTRQELRTGKYTAGFHVRRSPRDQNKTDIIIFSNDGRDITVSTAKKIERFFYGEEIKRVHREDVGTMSFPERTNEIYVDRYLGALDINLIQKSHFKLLIDYSFGYASTILPGILGKLNVAALSVHDYVDGSRFHPDPTENVDSKNEAGNIMRSLNYNLGFTLESGSEKIALIDQRGKWYSSQRLLTVVTKLFLETHKHLEPYSIAVSIVASKEIEDIAFDYNVDVIRIKNNHAAMMEATRNENIRFIGGIYGGFIFPEFLFASDGMFSVGKIIEMLAETNLKLSHLDEVLPVRHQVQKTVDCTWSMIGMIMRNLMEYSDGKQRHLVEGVKIMEGNNSALMMPNKEQSSFTIYGEADSKEEAESISNKFFDLINSWIQAQS